MKTITRRTTAAGLLSPVGLLMAIGAGCMPVQPLPAQPSPAQPGILGAWRVEAIDGAGVADDGTSPTIVFGADGRVGGTTGCNRFFGSHTLDGARLRVDELGSTKMACAPPLAGQEARLLNRLARVDTVTILPDGALRLESAQGGRLLLRRIGSTR